MDEQICTLSELDFCFIKTYQIIYHIKTYQIIYHIKTYQIIDQDRFDCVQGSGVNNRTILGVAVLKSVDIPAVSYWYWIGAAALFGFIVLFNVLFTFALMYLNRKSLNILFKMKAQIVFNVVTNLLYFFVSALGKPQAIISEETAAEIEGDQDELKEEPRLRRPLSKKDAISRSLSASDGNNSSKMHISLCSNSVFRYKTIKLLI